jgi:RNA polymerase sigma factor (sigma-70 family)
LRQARLENAISTLSEEAREIYTLRTGKNHLSYKELSEKLGKSENALRSIYKRANDKILSMMKDYDETLKSEIQK